MTAKEKWIKLGYKDEIEASEKRRDPDLRKERHLDKSELTNIDDCYSLAAIEADWNWYNYWPGVNEIGNLRTPEEVKQHASALKSHQHRLKKRAKQGKKVLKITSSYWSFHNGDSEFAYHLAGVDEEGKAAVKTLASNSFKMVDEARVAASLLGYEAYQSGIMHMIIE